MMTDFLQTQKASLRQKVLEKRRKLSFSQKKLWDEQIAETFFKSFDLSGFDCVLCYNSLSQEVDTSIIAKQLMQNGKKLFFPKTFVDGGMEFFEVTDETRFVKGFKGVFEPVGDTCRYENESALCIVPGLCFSEFGSRLGYGAGYYDRFLSGKNIKKVALSYNCFIFSEVPCSQHDVRMNHIITEHGAINCAEKSGGKR